MQPDTPTTPPGRTTAVTTSPMTETAPLDQRRAAPVGAARQLRRRLSGGRHRRPPRDGIRLVGAIFGCVAAGPRIGLLPRALIDPVWRKGRVSLHTLPAAESRVSTVFIHRWEAYRSSALLGFWIEFERILPCNRQIREPPVLVHRVAVGHTGHIIPDNRRRPRTARFPRSGAPIVRQQLGVAV